MVLDAVCTLVTSPMDEKWVLAVVLIFISLMTDDIIFTCACGSLT